MDQYVIALILGVIEGITECIPVSSTGHMIIIGHMLNFEGTHADVFEVFIQIGACRKKNRTDNTGNSEKLIITMLPIGLYQMLCLWPGFSRSGATIAGGMLIGCTRRLQLIFRLSWLYQL